MKAVAGYEKAWASLLAGSVIPLQTLALWLASIAGAVPAPAAPDVQAAITGIVSALLGAAGAYLATNTETTL
jgi:hypothetical protein